MNQKNQDSKNIFQKMLEAQTILGVVNKNLNVSTGVGKGSYKAVCERDILDAVKPVEAELGIYSYPFDRKIVSIEKRTTSKGYDQNFIEFEIVYRFVNVDKPEEYIDIKSYGTGIDSGDKADGKGMTYADKYALMKAYKISTGDDPDKDASVNNIDMTKVTKEYFDARKKLIEVGGSLEDEKVVDYIKKHARVNTIDIQLEDLESTYRVIKIFKELTQMKQQQQ